jgi:hypothetical protein
MLQNSSLAIFINMHAMERLVQEKELRVVLKVPVDRYDELKSYFELLAVEDLLFGMRFSYNRKAAEEGGYLLPGRKSFVTAETKGLSQSQAQWRLTHWKAMIRSYREKGYSYPTISRIKKKVRTIAATGG